MRVVLDTNILVSALLVHLGHPAAIYRAWQGGHFTLLICREQLDELRATLHKPAIAARIKPYKAGRLVNQLSELAENIVSLPRVVRSPDPTDDFLLALSEASKANYLVTGDKSGLLTFGRHKNTRIISARDFAALFA
ncbi:MAG TPA: putative toxin-antitoxin system toxin component, PIN family [Bryobacteraceae bacterium]|jgi:putative PIN family toxin of toxin-antitoxin system|nr:putative toxin-antitoxin system toxin component, PIN family [Bryobacteraceae bacterium]